MVFEIGVLVRNAAVWNIEIDFLLEGNDPGTWLTSFLGSGVWVDEVDCFLGWNKLERSDEVHRFVARNDADLSWTKEQDKDSLLDWYEVFGDIFSFSGWKEVWVEVDCFVDRKEVEEFNDCLLVWNGVEFVSVSSCSFGWKKLEDCLLFESKGSSPFGVSSVGFGL